MNQNRGFSNIILIVLIVILAGTTSYFAMRKPASTNTASSSLPPTIPSTTINNITTQNNSGESLEEASRSIPGAPESVTAERIEPSKVKVIWKPYGPDIVYHIFVAEADGNITSKSPMRLIGYSRQPSYIDETAPTNTNLFYAVTAFNIWGNESRKSISPRVNRVQ